MEEAVMIVLPNRDEMFSRLRSVAGNTAELNKFYMQLFKHAGQRYCPHDMVTMIINAIADHTINMSAIDTDILIGEAPRFIDALVYDQVAAKMIKTEFQERMATA